MTKEKPIEELHLDDLTIKIVRSARRKRLSLEIGSQGVIARAPMRMRVGIIEQFIQHKQHWIKQHAQNLPPALEPLKIENGTILKLMDKDIQLSISLHKRGSTMLHNGILNLPIIKTNRPLQASIKDKLIRWYKQQALTCLRDKVAFYADEMNIPLAPNMNIKVRHYKRRWGSCDHKGDLSFNWRIIMAPEPVIDYVTIHELAHLREFNHSKKFWQIVSAQMPDWKQQQQWLHEHGAKLYRI